jgi:GNAT superfamily N-acetyltransferase
MAASEIRIDCHPLTPERWNDFVHLFGKTGAYGGCWCMWWRQTRSEFQQKHGVANRRAMKRIVDSGNVPGVLGYLDGKAVGWVSIAPREQFVSLERSRVVRRLDDVPVWSLVCLFVHRAERRRGVAESLVRCAVAYAESRGAPAIEAYPTEPRGRKLQPVSSFVGTPELFRRAGFLECARPSKSRVIMRFYTRNARTAAPKRRRQRN